MTLRRGPRGARRLRARRARARGARGGRGACRELSGVRRGARARSPGCPRSSVTPRGSSIPPAPPAVEERLLDRIARERGAPPAAPPPRCCGSRAGARSRSSARSPACWSVRARPRSPSAPATAAGGRDRAVQPAARRRHRRLGACRALTRARRDRGPSLGQGAGARLGVGLRGALRARGLERQRRHVPRRCPRPRVRGAHDRGARRRVRADPRRPPRGPRPRAPVVSGEIQ